MDLPVKYKAFWFYICDQCDIAGFWEPNMRLAIAQIGEPMELVEILRIFERRIEQTKDGKLWIRKFIEFQQGKELNPDNHAHLGILNRLNSNKVSSPLPIKGPKQPFTSPSRGAGAGLARPASNSNSKGKEGESEGKRPAPIYDKLPPKREPTAQELATAQRVAREETQKLKRLLKEGSA
jgi:hypothetical protein